MKNYGVTIDWTSQNIMPALQELINRIAIKNIVLLGILILSTLITIFIVWRCIKGIIDYAKEYNKKEEEKEKQDKVENANNNNGYYHQFYKAQYFNFDDVFYNTITVIYFAITMIMAFLLLIELLVFACGIGDLITGICTPELTLLNYLK